VTRGSRWGGWPPARRPWSPSNGPSPAPPPRAAAAAVLPPTLARQGSAASDTCPTGFTVDAAPPAPAPDSLRPQAEGGARRPAGVLLVAGRWLAARHHRPPLPRGPHGAVSARAGLAWWPTPVRRLRCTAWRTRCLTPPSMVPGARCVLAPCFCPPSPATGDGKGPPPPTLTFSLQAVSGSS
jgi:hypothetical protein